MRGEASVSGILGSRLKSGANGTSTCIGKGHQNEKPPYLYDRRPPVHSTNAHTVVVVVTGFAQQTATSSERVIQEHHKHGASIQLREVWESQEQLNALERPSQVRVQQKKQQQEEDK
eukprot:5685566-Amphidinium_carterae.1